METQQTIENRKNKLNAGFFFLSLGTLISLITSVVSFLNLVFATLDKQFKDVLNSAYEYGYVTSDYENIRTALAILIIFFPVFLIISHFWKKYNHGDMSHFDEIIKKWLIHIVLFLSGLVAVIDLVILVKYFVAGEITNRFLLKVLAVLVVVVFVGIYYILELKKQKKIFGFSIDLWAGIKSSLLVILVIGYGFYIMGSPKTQRFLRLDERRVQDLQSIQYAVVNYWQQKEKLPEVLSDLTNPISNFYLPIDPEFEKGFVYEYKAIDKLKFELCATFSLPIPKDWRSNDINPSSDIFLNKSVSHPVVGGINESWQHEAGYTCFVREIDPEIFPPFNN